MAHKRKQTERKTETDPILIGGYVKAMKTIRFKKAKLTIPQGTKGIVVSRKSKHSFEIVWPQAFEEPLIVNENSIMRA